MTEPELIAAAKAGDQDAWASLYVQMWPKVRATCRGILKTDDVDDVCQETMLAVLREMGDFSGKTKLSTWAYRIATTTCIDWIRAQRSRDKLADVLIPAINRHGKRAIEERIYSQQAIVKLRGKTRDCALLLLEGFEVGEIAAKLAISTRHVRRLCNRSSQCPKSTPANA